MGRLGLFHGGFNDFLVFDWAITGAGCAFLDFFHSFVAFHNLTKDRVAVVQPGSEGRGYEKLTAVGVGAGIGHGQNAFFGKAEAGIEFVLKFATPEGLPTSAGACGIATLNHEIRNDPVENNAVIIALFDQSAEVFHSFRGLIRKQTNANTALIGFQNSESFLCIAHFVRTSEL